VLSSPVFKSIGFKISKLKAFLTYSFTNFQVDVNYVRLFSEPNIDASKIIRGLSKPIAQQLSWIISPLVFSALSNDSVKIHLLRLISDKIPKKDTEVAAIIEPNQDHLSNWDRLLFRSLSIFAFKNTPFSSQNKARLFKPISTAIKLIEAHVNFGNGTRLRRLKKESRQFESIMNVEKVSDYQHLAVLSRLGVIFKFKSTSRDTNKDFYTPDELARLDLTVNFVLNRVDAYADPLPGDWLLNLDHLISNALDQLPLPTLTRFWTVFLQRKPTDWACLSLLQKWSKRSIVMPLLSTERIVRLFKLDPLLFKNFLGMIPYSVRCKNFFQNLRNSGQNPGQKIIFRPSIHLVFKTKTLVHLGSDWTRHLSPKLFFFEDIVHSLWTRCFEHPADFVLYEPVILDKKNVSFTAFLSMFWDLFYDLGLKYKFFSEMSPRNIFLSPILPMDLVQIIGLMLIANATFSLAMPFTILNLLELPDCMPSVKNHPGFCALFLKENSAEKTNMANFFAHLKRLPFAQQAISQSKKTSLMHFERIFIEYYERIQTNLILGMNRLATNSDAYFTNEELHRLVFAQHEL